LRPQATDAKSSSRPQPRLTLTGPGGSGKTRLAIEAAASLVPDYEAGVYWVGLAALRDPAVVTETISRALGARDGLAEHTGERKLLVLLRSARMYRSRTFRIPHETRGVR